MFSCNCLFGACKYSVLRIEVVILFLVKQHLALWCHIFTLICVFNCCSNRCHNIVFLRQMIRHTSGKRATVDTVPKIEPNLTANESISLFLCIIQYTIILYFKTLELSKFVYKLLSSGWPVLQTIYIVFQKKLSLSFFLVLKRAKQPIIAYFMFMLYILVSFR